MHFLYGLPHGSENHIDRGTHSESDPACVRSPNCMVFVAFIRYSVSPCFPVSRGTVRTEPHTLRPWGTLASHRFHKGSLPGSPAPGRGVRQQGRRRSCASLCDLLVFQMLFGGPSLTV